MTMIDRGRLGKLRAREEKRFVDEHPRSAELYARAEHSLLGGVPMNWLQKWAGAFPVFVKSAKGAHFTCVDGREYVDLCLGDTGAMTGHSPDVVVEAVAKRAREGITLMLPTKEHSGPQGARNRGRNCRGITRQAPRHDSRLARGVRRFRSPCINRDYRARERSISRSFAGWAKARSAAPTRLIRAIPRGLRFAQPTLQVTSAPPP